QGRQGRSRNRRRANGTGRPTQNPAIFAANQHCQTLEGQNPRPKPLTVRCRCPAPGRSRREMRDAAMVKDGQDG
ncbi:hypothetical protein D1G06_11900, partial [Staphylococcus aureus]